MLAYKTHDTGYLTEVLNMKKSWNSILELNFKKINKI
jgi:hypothetical protein